MIALVLDTNAIHGDPWLTSPLGAVLLGLAEDGSCLVVIPEVVRDEVRRQRREQARASHGRAAEAIEAMAKAGIDVTETRSQLDKAFKRIDADIDGAFENLLNHTGVAMEPVPSIKVADILARDLARRRPFIEVARKHNPASVGFRDTLIWETVLAVLNPSRSHEKVILVSADKGFLGDDSKVIHPDLLTDLDGLGIDPSRLENAKNIYQAAATVKQTADEIALIAAATDALYDLVGEDVGMQLVYGGDYDYPDFVQFPVPMLENAYISDIEQGSEFSFVRVDSLVTARADATVYLGGAVFTGDWLTGEADGVELGDVLNDHYFEGSSSIDVEVVVELDVAGVDPEVRSIALKDPEGQT